MTNPKPASRRDSQSPRAALLAVGLLLGSFGILVATCVQAQRVESQLQEAARLLHEMPRTVEYCGNARCTCGRVCTCCRCP